MKITVRDLGMISLAEIDINPLTVLVGPNNAGKTWLAYLLSGIFSPHSVQEYLETYDDDDDGLANPLSHLETLVSNIISKGQASIEMVEFVEGQGEIYINQVATLTSTWIAEYLGTNKVDFSHLEIDVKLADSKKTLQERIAKLSFTSKLAFGSDENEALLTARKSARDQKLLFYTSGASPISQLPEEVIKAFVADVLLQALFQSIYARTFVFPTERTTFITFPFEEDKNIKTRQVSAEEMSELQSGSRLMPSATGSFLRMVMSLYKQSLKKRMQAAQKDAFIKRAMDLSQVLQTQILGGTLDFSSPDPEPGREILFKPIEENVSSMEMSIVSSMVKELAPLVLYLRYLARPRELIIIDEPEMNLHPEAQAKLIEFLAMLVNAGLHVLITTHSPYMVDHLENLMTASEHPEQASKIREEFFLQNEDAFISKEKVAVYLVDHGTATNIFQDDGHIHWDTFSDISDKVGGLYSKLLEDDM